jgi:hypothetical protein
MTTLQARIRMATAAGMAGPIAFLLLIAVQQVIQFDFLVSLGQDPRVQNPVSFNALGPYGWIQTLNFLQLGASLLALSWALKGAWAPRGSARRARLLLAGVGVAMLGSAGTMDRGHVHSWHGWMHGLSFVLFVLTALPLPFVAFFALRRDARWRVQARLALAAAVVLPAILVTTTVFGSQVQRIAAAWPGLQGWWSPAGRLHLGLLYGWVASLGFGLWRLTSAAASAEASSVDASRAIGSPAIASADGLAEAAA